MLTIRWAMMLENQLGTILLLTILSSGCTDIYKSEDFRRHQFSELTIPHDGGGAMYFDVTFTPEFPDGDEAAETERMAWLQGWLDQRKMCGNGFEIDNRREFEYTEDNPAHYDIRYEVKCTSATSTE